MFWPIAKSPLCFNCFGHPACGACWSWRFQRRGPYLWGRHWGHGSKGAWAFGSPFFFLWKRGLQFTDKHYYVILITMDHGRISLKQLQHPWAPGRMNRLNFCISLPGIRRDSSDWAAVFASSICWGSFCHLMRRYQAGPKSHPRGKSLSRCRSDPCSSDWFGWCRRTFSGSRVAEKLNAWWQNRAKNQRVAGYAATRL